MFDSFPFFKLYLRIVSLFSTILQCDQLFFNISLLWLMDFHIFDRFKCIMITIIFENTNCPSLEPKQSLLLTPESFCEGLIDFDTFLTIWNNKMF